MDAYRGTKPDRPINLNKTVAEPLVQWIEVSSRGTREMSEQVASFVTERTKRTVDTIGQIAQCDNITSMFELQERWISDALRDYTEQSQRMMAIGNTMMREFFHQPERHK